MKIFHFFQQIQKSLETSYTPSIILGLKNLPTLNSEIFYNLLPQIEPLNSEIYVSFETDPNTQTFYGYVEFEKHKIQFLGNSADFPDHIIDTCIHTAHWEEPHKIQLLSSTAHINLVYSGNSLDPIENYIALYKVAACFYDENLLGIVNEPAWTFHPAGLLPKLVFNNMINLCRNSPPFLFWTGFIKTSLDIYSPSSNQKKSHCFFTKGHHVLGIPDLAFYSKNSDPMKIKKLFNDILEYAWFERKELQPGDYIGFNENEVYELIEPEENLEFLYSPTKTLILKPINTDINI